MTIFLFRNCTTKKKENDDCNKKWQNGRHCEERKRRSNLKKHLLAANGLLRRVYTVARNDNFFVSQQRANDTQLRNDDFFYSAKISKTQTSASQKHQKNKYRNFTISDNFNYRFILYTAIKNQSVRFCPNLMLVRLFLSHYNLLS